MKVGYNFANLTQNQLSLIAPEKIDYLRSDIYHSMKTRRRIGLVDPEIIGLNGSLKIKRKSIDRSKT